MNRLLQVVGVIVVVLGIVIVSLWWIFSRLPKSLRAGTKAFTAVYKSSVVPASKRFLMSDGNGKFCLESEAVPNQSVTNDYFVKKTYIIDKKDGTYTAYDLVKEGLADENAYRVPPYVQLLFLGNGNRNGYDCRHYIALFFFCFAGYLENWFSPELGCSVEFSPCFGFQPNGRLTLLKYSAEKPPEEKFDLSRFKQKADYSHK